MLPDLCVPFLLQTLCHVWLGMEQIFAVSATFHWAELAIFGSGISYLGPIVGTKNSLSTS